MSETHSLPAPDELEAYERLVPGAAERILVLAEQRAEQEAWIESTLAREERLTRLMSYGSALFGVFASSIGFAAFLWKFFER